jgi:hypothetical protein
MGFMDKIALTNDQGSEWSWMLGYKYACPDGSFGEGAEGFDRPDEALARLNELLPKPDYTAFTLTGPDASPLK